MSIKAVKEDGTIITIDIPEYKLMQFERDIEVFVPEGQYPREKTVEMWCRRVRIKCVKID